MIVDDTAELLSQADFFDICDDQELAMLGFASDRQFFAAGERIYQAGDVPEGALVLASGAVRVSHDGVEAGEPYTLSAPGSVISPTALIIAKPRPISVVAESDSELLLVPRSAFLKLARKSPALAQKAADRIQQELGSYMHALDPLRKKMTKP